MGEARSLHQIAEQGYFFAGGRYIEHEGATIRIGQMFVQYQVPAERREPFPVVMFHGGGQTGTNYLGTPDGRKGWADYFLEQGYAVFVVDQPGRARSGYFPAVYGKTRRPTAELVERRFTAPAVSKLWPQAHLHTRWPGTGRRGDPIFDQFFSSQVESIEDGELTESLVRDAGVALLDRIGPAILLTHSQSGPFGWSIGDRAPERVRAILAIEPNGPPLHELELLGAPQWFADGPRSRPWGITRVPLTYDPPVKDSAELRFVKQEKPDSAGFACCWLQAEPARKLSRLAGIPILIVTSEASYHAAYDHATSKYLEQAGVEHTFLRLPDIGMRGNGHMMMLEENNLEIAAVLHEWVSKQIGKT